MHTEGFLAWMDRDFIYCYCLFPPVGFLMPTSPSRRFYYAYDHYAHTHPLNALLIYFVTI